MVLLIDDEPQMGSLVGMCLHVMGARVVQASNLADAVEATREETPSVVLLDLALGKEDGLRILPDLRREPGLSEVPVVAFSVHDSRREEALAKGAVGFLTKPFHPTGLREALQPLLPRTATQ